MATKRTPKAEAEQTEIEVEGMPEKRDLISVSPGSFTIYLDELPSTHERVSFLITGEVTRVGQEARKDGDRPFFAFTVEEATQK